MSKKIAVIGECMIELSEKGAQVNRGFGGDTLNTSVYIARQVSPAELSVNYVTALGTDTFSQQMMDAWQAENVKTDLIQRMSDRMPGLYYIETDDTGERTFYTGVTKPRRSSGWRASSLPLSVNSWQALTTST